MVSARKRVPIHRETGLTGDFSELMRALKTLVDPYRPEEHYMRGPGPKWHEKHDPAAADADAGSMLVSIKS